MQISNLLSRLVYNDVLYIISELQYSMDCEMNGIKNLNAHAKANFYSLQRADRDLKTGQCKTQTADCRLQTRGKMQTEGKMQTADCGPRVKCRLTCKTTHRA